MYYYDFIQGDLAARGVSSLRSVCMKCCLIGIFIITPIMAQDSAARLSQDMPDEGVNTSPLPIISETSELPHVRSAAENESTASSKSATVTSEPNGQMHPWGQFNPGAWRLVRTTTESISSAGELVNRTCSESRITLQKTEKNTVIYVVETGMNIAGKCVKIEPKTVTHHIFGISTGESPVMQYLEPQQLMIEGRPVICHVYQLTFSDGISLTKVKVWYNADQSPHLFRREVVVKNPKYASALEHSIMEITSLNAPVSVLGKIYPAYRTHSVTRLADREIRTSAISASNIPGGVVSRSTREMTLSGTLLQQTTLELLDFGLTANDSQNGSLYRAQDSRPARQTVMRPHTTSFGNTEKGRRLLNFSFNFTHRDNNTELTEKKDVSAATDLKLKVSVSREKNSVSEHEVDRPPRGGRRNSAEMRSWFSRFKNRKTRFLPAEQIQEEQVIEFPESDQEY